MPDFTDTITTIENLIANEQNVATGHTNDLAASNANVVAYQAVLSALQSSQQLITDLQAQVVSLGATPVTS